MPPVKRYVLRVRRDGVLAYLKLKGKPAEGLIFEAWVEDYQDATWFANTRADKQCLREYQETIIEMRNTQVPGSITPNIMKYFVKADGKTYNKRILVGIMSLEIHRSNWVL